MRKPIPAGILAMILGAAWLGAAGPALAGSCMESEALPPLADTLSLRPVQAPPKALDMSRPAPNAPAALGLWTFHGGPNQRWNVYMGLSARLPASYMIKTTADRRCLVWGRPLPPLTERLHTAPCNGEDPAQRWCVNSAGGGGVRIRNYQQGGCLTVGGDPSQEGTPATLQPCDNSPAQRWLLR